MKLYQKQTDQLLRQTFNLFNNQLRAIKGIARTKLYQELGLEFLVDQRWSRELFLFHKILLGLLSFHLQDV